MGDHVTRRSVLIVTTLPQCGRKQGRLPETAMIIDRRSLVTTAMLGLGSTAIPGFVGAAVSTAEQNPATVAE